MIMVILELRNVTKEYGSLKALSGVNLTVGGGEWTAIMGPSGSGKTTMMNIIGCMDRPTSGEVIIDGQNISRSADLTSIRREKIGLVFQQFYLIPYLNALENVMAAQYYHSVTDEAEAREALSRVGLAEREKHKPRQLSGGEQQRLCIARALINYPRLILADEPTGNLDAANAQIVMRIFHSLHAAGSTVIMVTHSQEAASHAQRTIILGHGKIEKVVENA